jgi:hypothetical protein
MLLDALEGLRGVGFEVHLPTVAHRPQQAFETLEDHRLIVYE